jgi:hypothetical protein
MDSGKTNILPMECEPLVPKQESKKSFFSSLLSCFVHKEQKIVLHLSYNRHVQSI